LGFGGEAAKTNQKLLGAASPPRTPPPEADVATALGDGGFAAITTQKLW
jgi:hypothetical protein